MSFTRGELRLPATVWLASGLAALLGLGAWLVVTPDDVDPVSVAAVPGARAAPIATTGEEPLFTFVSMPDFLNTDVGDTRLRAGQGWDPGDPTSMNAPRPRLLAVMLDEVVAQQPTAVLVAADLVDGHWCMDVAPATGIFGPVGTRAEQLAAVTNAGDLYSPAWANRFTERG